MRSEPLTLSAFPGHLCLMPFPSLRTTFSSLPLVRACSRPSPLLWMTTWPTLSRTTGSDHIPHLPSFVVSCHPAPLRVPPTTQCAWDTVPLWVSNTLPFLGSSISPATGSFPPADKCLLQKRTKKQVHLPVQTTEDLPPSPASHSSHTPTVLLSPLTSQTCLHTLCPPPHLLSFNWLRVPPLYHPIRAALGSVSDDLQVAKPQGQSSVFSDPLAAFAMTGPSFLLKMLL